jgi:predicted flap endonuclease-1-like 5' DNA nuclease
MNVTPAQAPGASVAMFVLGLLVGWLAEWVIDWYYWRSRMYSVARENTDLKARLSSLEAERNQGFQPDKGIALTDKAGRDNFEAIKGIGPVFARRLREAGIHTFEQLSRLTPGQLGEILGERYRRLFSNQENILAQAKDFAQQRAQTK